MKSYGRAPTFLLRTGYEQVRSVVAALAGDWESARDVELVLPETGVCSVNRDADGRPRPACCGSGSPLLDIETPRSADDALDRGAARTAGHGAVAHPRAWGIVGALSVTETVSWGILYYAFAVFLIPMQRELGFSTAELTGAFSLALLVSAVAGIAVGRWLDRRSPRGLMTAGSIAATALVLAWSQVDGLAAFYALWIAIGLVMAVVLYEPAFTVLAKWFPDADRAPPRDDRPHARRRPRQLHLPAALAGARSTHPAGATRS